MKEFPSAEGFFEQLGLMELQAIVRHLWKPVFEGVVNPPGVVALTFSAMAQAHWALLKARNDVMHMRSVPQAAYPGIRSHLERQLEAMEFNLPASLENIRATPLTPNVRPKSMMAGETAATGQ